MSKVAQLRQFLANFLRGLLMGAADVIPGVSGGTVALILGIYARLVTAISHVDRMVVSDIAAGRWRKAAEHLDLSFLAALGAGVAAGILLLARVIHALMESDVARPLTWAAFFGMIAASALLVARMIHVKDAGQLAGCVLGGVIGAAAAFWLTFLPVQTSADPSYLYLFACGMVAICAMILPGISGAHILLVLGVYGYVTGIIKELTEGRITGAAILALIVFAAGCAVGLIGFSKILKWLLANFHALTMAVLCGFMVGALRKVWPFQRDTMPEVSEFKHKVYEPMMPSHWATAEWTALGVMVLAFAAVLGLEWLARRAAKGA